MSEWPARDFDVEPENPLPGLEDVSDDEFEDEDEGLAAGASGGPGASALEPDDVVAWAPGAPHYPSAASIPSSMRIWFRPGGKKGASGIRFAAYSTTTTVREYRLANAGPFMAADLAWDLKRGIAWLRPGTVVAHVEAEAPWGRPGSVACTGAERNAP